MQIVTAARKPEIHAIPRLIGANEKLFSPRQSLPVLLFRSTMNSQGPLQRAATNMFKRHSTPILAFPVPHANMSTTPSASARTKIRHRQLNEAAKQVDMPGHVFRKSPGNNRPSPTPAHLQQQQQPTTTPPPTHIFDIPSTAAQAADPGTLPPPTQNTPPFLKIIMTRSKGGTPTTGHFRPAEPTVGKWAPGSTVSSAEREIFAKIFDEMLTAPVQAPLKKMVVKADFQRRVDEKVGAKRVKGEVAAALDDSLFLSMSEVAEYPVALQPLASKYARLKDDGPINRDWRNWEKRLNSCSTDHAMIQFLETNFFIPLKLRNDNGNKNGTCDDATTPGGKITFTSIAENYPRILQKAMNLLRVHFRNPLAAHTLFQRAKALSAESYVLGCTTAVYNEWMLVRWEEFRDLAAVVELVEEMGMNGVRADEKTVRIVEEVVRDVEEWGAHGPEAIRPLWAGERERVGRLEKVLREIRAQMERPVEVELDGQMGKVVDKESGDQMEKPLERKREKQLGEWNVEQSNVESTAQLDDKMIPQDA